jgi:hypothetical protein
MQLSDIVDPAATLIAAFAGSWIAFQLENRRRKREEDARRISAVNFALYTIFNMWNYLAQVRKEIVQPYRGRRDAWLNMPATFADHSGIASFDSGALSFLLGENSPLYCDVMLEEQRFAHTVGLVRTRTRMVIDQVFPRLTAAGVGIKDNRPEDEIERILGTGVVHQLKIIGGGLVTETDETLASLEKIFGSLREAARAKFPKQKFISVQFSLPDPPEAGR